MVQQAYDYAKNNDICNTSFKKKETSDDGKFTHEHSFAEEVRFKVDDEIIVANVIRETKCYAFVLCSDGVLKKKKKTSFIITSTIETPDDEDIVAPKLAVNNTKKKKVVTITEKSPEPPETDMKKRKLESEEHMHDGLEKAIGAPPRLEQIIPDDVLKKSKVKNIGKSIPIKVSSTPMEQPTSSIRLPPTLMMNTKKRKVDAIAENSPERLETDMKKRKLESEEHMHDGLEKAIGAPPRLEQIIPDDTKKSKVINLGKSSPIQVSSTPTKQLSSSIRAPPGFEQIIPEDTEELKMKRMSKPNPIQTLLTPTKQSSSFIRAPFGFENVITSQSPPQDSNYFLPKDLLVSAKKTGSNKSTTRRKRPRSPLLSCTPTMKRHRPPLIPGRTPTRPSNDGGRTWNRKLLMTPAKMFR